MQIIPEDYSLQNHQIGLINDYGDRIPVLWSTILHETAHAWAFWYLLAVNNQNFCINEIHVEQDRGNINVNFRPLSGNLRSYAMLLLAGPWISYKSRGDLIGCNGDFSMAEDAIERSAWNRTQADIAVENFMQQHLNSIVHLAHTIVLHDRTRVPKAVCEREFSKLAPRVYGGTIKELKEY